MSGFCSVRDNVVKVILFLFNIIFSGIGIVTLTMGIILLVELHVNFGNVRVDLSVVSITIIVIGCIVICVGLCGAWGSLMEITWQLVLYSVIMAIFVAIEIGFVVILYGRINSAKEFLSDWVTKTFQDYNLAETFYAVEAFMHCCGTTGPGSYEGKQPILPPSCCPESNIYDICTEEAAFKIGCVDAFPDYFAHIGYATGNVVIISIIVEAVAVTMSLYMTYVLHKNVIV